MPFSRSKMKTPSVSAVIGQLDKPALLQWVANLTADWIKQEILRRETIDQSALLSLCEEARQAWKRKQEEAMDQGKAIHEMIRKAYKNIWISHPDMPPNLLPAFQHWWKAQNLYPLRWEERFHAQEGYTGIYDLYAKQKNAGILIDFKSTNSHTLYYEHRLQIAAYHHALARELDIDQAWIVTLNKRDGTVKSHDCTPTLEQDWKIFHLLLQLWYIINKD